MKPEGTISSIQPQITDKSNKFSKSASPVLGIAQICEDGVPESIEDLSLLPGNVVATFWMLSFRSRRSMRELVHEAVIDHRSGFDQRLPMRRSA